MQGQGEMRYEEQPEGGQPMECPTCGQRSWGPRGPWGMKHGGPWAMKHHGGPWGMAPWMGGPMGMACSIVPALMGFALGFLVASARMAAWYAYSEGKHRR